MKSEPKEVSEDLPGRSSYGERGLKLQSLFKYIALPCRSSYGERGLKYLKMLFLNPRLWSLLLRGAWIEI